MWTLRVHNGEALDGEDEGWVFNLGRFNLLRFNVRAGDDDDIRLTSEMGAFVRAMVGSGENIFEAGHVAEAMGGRSQGAAGEPEAQAMGVWTGCAAAAETVLPVQMRAVERVDGAQRMVTISWIVGEWLASLLGAGTAGGNVRGEMQAEAALSGTVRYGAEVHAGTLALDEAVLGYLDSRTMATEEILLDVTIPPGGKLVVDSNTYEVLLSGMNVIDKHSGAWLHLDRDVSEIRLDVTKGRAGDLRAELAYVEKWM